MNDVFSLKKEPIFIICTARSGSTLLRYVLDTHKDIVSPPETHLILLIEELTRILTVLYSKSPHDNIKQNVHSQVREYVDLVMRDWMQDNHKFWCDKSVSTVNNLELVKAVFPNAKYICLYRHCLDFVHSAMEVSRYGWKGYGFENFVTKNPGNIIEALVEYWCVKTSAMLSFEERYKNHCIRVKYETLVNDPESTTRELIKFLGLEFDPHLVSKIFSTKHQEGQGDLKILSTKKIEKNSVGKGYKIPFKKLEIKTLLKMNSILGQLDYREVDKEWNRKIPPNLIYGSQGDGKYISNALTDIFEREIPERLLNHKQHLLNYSHHTLKVVLKNVFDSNWLIDFNQLQAQKVHPASQADCTVILDFETLIGLLNKELNIAVGLNQGLIEVTGNLQITAAAACLFY